MQEVVKINNNNLPIMRYNGQRVITFKDVDRVHERPDGTASRNFRTNRKHFIEKEDFFIVRRNDFQKDDIRPLGFTVPNRGIILFTESGYLMIVKSFTDDLAWDVQRQLVNGYFKLKELTQQQPQPIQSPYKLETMQKQVDSLNCEMSLFLNRLSTLERTINKSISTSQHEVKMTIPNMSQQIDIDIIRDTIRPLAEAFNDGSSGFNATFRKVYAAMGCDWKYRRTRYRNKKGNRNIPSNFTLLESDKKLMKLYIDTVDRMLKEVETNN